MTSAHVERLVRLANYAAMRRDILTRDKFDFTEDEAKKTWKPVIKISSKHFQRSSYDIAIMVRKQDQIPLVSLWMDIIYWNKVAKQKEVYSLLLLIPSCLLKRLCSQWFPPISFFSFHFFYLTRWKQRFLHLLIRFLYSKYEPSSCWNITESLVRTIEFLTNLLSNAAL